MSQVSEDRRFASIRLVWDSRIGKRMRNRTVGEAIAVAVAIGKPVGIFSGADMLGSVWPADEFRRRRT